MPSFIRNTSGGTSVSGGGLAPRSRRGNTNQTDGYWRGGGGLSYNIATGGNTLTNYTASGIQYRSHVFSSSGTFAITALGTESACDIMVHGGGGSGSCTPNGRGYGDGSGGSGGMATTTMLLPVGSYQVTVGGVSGQSSFGVSTSLITANGGSGGGECEFCCGGGGAGGTATVSGALGTSSVTQTGLSGTGGCSCSGSSVGRSNTYQDGTTRNYGGQRDGSYYGCSGCQAAVNTGGGGQGGHTNCGCNGGGANGVVIVRYKFVP
jgi:hypothetical protein